MKKIFVLFLMAISSYTIAQSSIQPSLGLNIWNVSLGGFGGSATATFFEIGADYESAFTHFASYFRTTSRVDWFLKK